MYKNNGKTIKSINSLYNINKTFGIFNKNIKNNYSAFKFKSYKKKRFYDIANLRGRLTRFGYFRTDVFVKKYDRYLNNFLFPNSAIGRILRKFYKRKLGRRMHHFVLEKYQKFFPFFRKSIMLERIAFFLRKKKKALSIQDLRLNLRLKRNIYKKKIAKWKGSLQFSIKNFYKYYVLKLFKDSNFKYFFFNLLGNINKNLDLTSRYLFLKYEFFGHAYFKNKLFKILKFKILNNLFFFFKRDRKDKRKKIFKYKNFYYKINFLKRLKYNFSFIKNWLLNFFLNKYWLSDFLVYKDLNVNRMLILDLRKIFFLYFSIYDKNYKSSVLFNKKFSNWLFYNVNRKKQKIKNLFEVFGYEDDFYYTSETFNKRFLINLYRSLVIMQLNIKLNNVFVTLSNIKGEVLFKYSTGFYGIRGRKKRDPLTLYKITNNVSKRLKKFKNLNLILKIKRKYRNKYYRQVLNSLKKNKIIPACYFFIVNRSISKRRLKKARRL